jgi:hypothetical protein
MDENTLQRAGWTRGSFRIVIPEMLVDGWTNLSFGVHEIATVVPCLTMSRVAVDEVVLAAASHLPTGYRAIVTQELDDAALAAEIIEAFLPEADIDNVPPAVHGRFRRDAWAALDEAGFVFSGIPTVFVRTPSTRLLDAIMREVAKSGEIPSTIARRIASAYPVLTAGLDEPVLVNAAREAIEAASKAARDE